MHMPFRAAALTIAFATAFAVPSTAQVKLDVIYVPTPEKVVARMLEMADLKAGEFHIDLGSGDGRIAIAGAKRGARAFGVDIDPDRVKEATENAKKAGVSDRVEFRVQNLYETDISKADVLSLYLLTKINLDLRPRILSDMRPGARVVSHAFSMGEWEADARDTVEGRNVFLWYVPARVEGKWTLRQGERAVQLDLKQEFQKLSGTAQVDGRPVAISDGRLRGDEITFTITAQGGQPQVYKGKVSGNKIEGAEPAAWSATKG